MFRLPAVLFSLLLVLATAAPALAQQSTWQRILETKTLRLGAPIHDPWAFKDPSNSSEPGAVKVGDTTWRGVAPVLAKEMADSLGVKLEIVETTWGNAVAGLQANQFDLVYALDGTPQRAASIDFVPAPIMWYGVSILGQPTVKAERWEDLNDGKLRIGVPLGTTLDKAVTERAPNAQISRFQTTNEMLAAFQSGRVDAVSAMGPGLELARGRMKMGVVTMPEPAILYPTTCGIRQEVDPRWRNYLTTVNQYFQTSGKANQALLEAYKFRGVDIATVKTLVVK
jgi:polar amino acid transport system substrate-binding protein